MGQDPFDERIFGPEGWTGPLGAALGPYLLPGVDEVREVAGVPGSVAREVAGVLASHGAAGGELFDPVALDAALDTLGPGATVCGRWFPPTRNDERVELTEVRAEVGDWDRGQVDAAAAALAAAGLTAVLERRTGGCWLRVGLQR
jgi:hypothetical protein